MTTFEILDTITGEITFTDDLYNGIRALFASDDAEILATIAGLVEKVERGEYAGDEAAYLGIAVTTC